jgi:malate dehydrogenase
MIGVPVQLGKGGAEKVIEIELVDEERDALHRSAQLVRQNIAKLS